MLERSEGRAGSGASQIGSPEATRLELPMAARMERQMPQAGQQRGWSTNREGALVGSRRVVGTRLRLWEIFLRGGGAMGGLVVVLFGAGEK